MDLVVMCSLAERHPGRWVGASAADSFSRGCPRQAGVSLLARVSNPPYLNLLHDIVTERNGNVSGPHPIKNCYAPAFENESMRPRVEWMNQTDDRILELLDESGLELSPAILARNLDYSRSWVSRRLKKLLDAGLVSVEDSSYYSITQKGRNYLSGKLKADKIKIEDE